MAVFMGGRGQDLEVLLDSQLWASVLGALVTVWVIARFFYLHGFKKGAQVFWHLLPGWLIRSFLGIVTLVLAGELSFFLVTRSGSDQLADGAHVPLLTALSSTCALCALYAYGRIRTASPR